MYMHISIYVCIAYGIYLKPLYLLGLSCCQVVVKLWDVQWCVCSSLSICCYSCLFDLQNLLIKELIITIPTIPHFGDK